MRHGRSSLRPTLGYCLLQLRLPACRCARSHYLRSLSGEIHSVHPLAIQHLKCRRPYSRGIVLTDDSKYISCPIVINYRCFQSVSFLRNEFNARKLSAKIIAVCLSLWSNYICVQMQHEKRLLIQICSIHLNSVPLICNCI